MSPGETGRERAGQAARSGAIGGLFKTGLTAGKIRPVRGPFPVAPVGTAAGRWESGKSGPGSVAPGGGRCPVPAAPAALAARWPRVRLR